MVPEIPEVFQCMWEDCTMKFASAHDFYCHTLSHVKNTNKENSNKKAFVCAWDGKILILLKQNTQCIYLLNMFDDLQNMAVVLSLKVIKFNNCGVMNANFKKTNLK